MRAVTVQNRNDPGTVLDVPIPTAGERELLVRIVVAGINPVDWKSRDSYGRPTPFVLGQDFAGRVAAVGAKVTEYAVDERVFGIARDHGAFADYTLALLGDQRQPVAKIPDGVSDDDAAGLPTPALTALAGIERLGLRAGQVLLIAGVTGSVGQFAAQIAHDRKIRVAGTGAAANEKAARAAGVERFIAYDREDVIAAVRAAYPDGVDGVLDLVDNADAVKKMVEVMGHGTTIASTIHVFEASTAAFDERGLHAVDLSLFDTAQSSPAGLEAVAEMVLRGVLRVPIVAHRSLDDAVDALELQKSGKLAGKILLTT